ncbi:hypothetical protein IL992_22340 [Microbispora sp. NEAU-D428]|uniref:hypothetical protein n=1 Tax=Microbispora sitophila TaxID=2771537 RepID=UPI001865D728|nr:hypothetical protein [Microbispora sitophila]MBE3011916.1 hypothetical protein [Microbispora sitophila]
MLAALGDTLTLVTGVLKVDHLCVVPLTYAEREAAGQKALKEARTYGEARAAGWWQVDDVDRFPHLLDYYIELYEAANPDADLDEMSEGEIAALVLPDDDEPFSLNGHPAFDMSVSENAEPNEPDPDVDTDHWMPREIAERFGEVEGGWEAMPTHEWEKAEFVYPAQRRDEIEAALQALGFTVRRDDDLLWAYLGC